MNYELFLVFVCAVSQIFILPAIYSKLSTIAEI